MSRSFLPARWSELAPLLDAALDLEPSEQPAFLDRACGGDARLREALETLLAECARPDRLLAAGAVERFGALLAAPAGQLPEMLAGRYRVQRGIGAGGMATVYLARDIKHDRDVALKVLRADLSAAIGTDRFLSEVQIAARLDHPHILTLIDSGTADGTLFYVMPYVRGESLRARLARERQLSLDDALSIARQIASALDYAHAQGVVHRDIKPENILLHEGEAVLADFGIALAVAEAGGPRLTQTGLSLGTPQYMSPEQATGERTVDARSDIYSLGAVLYEMLAGEPPVTGATKQAIIAKLLADRPTRLRIIRDSVPEGVDSAVFKALSKVAADRFETAGAFIRALDTPSATNASTPPSPPINKRIRAALGVAGAVQMSEDTERLSTAVAGRYRLVRELGDGGMATVYLAHDEKHDRNVALKVLKPELAAVLGAERFVQEIKTTASLQHPHILPLFDSGTADGFLFYVMPYVDGETLREKLDREKQLGVDEAVRIAREVADALDYAHRHGIIHRDIKPENLLLHDGRPMVADFGIALAVSAAARGRMTETGLSLGTPHYMSPEQATAEKDITARSDIYSIGSVLYEMLTGNPPHTGGSAQQIIVKIITEPAASVTKHRRSVPANVAAAVAKTLEKLPADRFESAKAFADALGNTAYTHASGTAAFHSASTSAHGVSKRLLTAISILAAALLVTAVWGWRAALHQTTGTAVRFSALPPEVRPTLGQFNSPIALSPDGRDIVIAGTLGTSPQMLIRRTIDDPTPHEIPGTEGAVAPFFSFDGKWLGFFVSEQMKKVQLSGGAVLQVAVGERPPRGGTWTRGDRVILGANHGPLTSVPAVGGAPKAAAALDTVHGEVAQWYPLALEDGETVLYLSYRGSANTSRIGVASLGSGTVRLLDLPPSGAPLAVLEGKLIYVSLSGALMAVPFDGRTARVIGVPVLVIDSVASNANGVAKVAISRSGSLVMVLAQTGQLALSDLEGNAHVLFPEAKTFTHPRFSPDGKRVAVAVTTTRSSEIWIYDVATGRHGQLTSDGGVAPEWTPDGKRVLYPVSRFDSASHDLRWQPADFSGTATVLQRHPTARINGAVISRDGHWLVYDLIDVRGGPGDIWFRRLDGDTTSQSLATTKFAEQVPAISPDGRWVAYTSDQSGLVEVYVQPFPGVGPRYPVSAGGGQTPRWSPDSRHIYYVTKGQLTVATVSTSPGFAVTSTPLFKGSYDFPVAPMTNYDVAPDGQHLLLVVSNAQIVMVHDWKYELRERIAQAKKR